MSHTSSVAASPHSRLQLTASLSCDSGSFSVNALVDSGADDNFMDLGFARKVGIPLEALPDPITVKALDGRILARITHCTIPLQLQVSGNHSEIIRFYVLPSPHSPIVLGLTWLKQHNPHIDWVSSSVASWSIYCHSHCLQSALGPPLATNKSSPEVIDLSSVPPVYHVQ